MKRPTTGLRVLVLQGEDCDRHGRDQKVGAQCLQRPSLCVEPQHRAVQTPSESSPERRGAFAAWGENEVRARRGRGRPRLRNRFRDVDPGEALFRKQNPRLVSSSSATAHVRLPGPAGPAAGDDEECIPRTERPPSTSSSIRAWNKPAEQQVDAALPEFPELLLSGLGRQNAHGYRGYRRDKRSITAGTKPRRIGISERPIFYLSRSGVGQELDVPDALLRAFSG